jgi:hypothetical protein
MEQMSVQFLGRTTECGIVSSLYKISHTSSVDLRTLWEFSKGLLETNLANNKDAEPFKDSAQVDVWPDTMTTSTVVLSIAVTKEGNAELEDQNGIYETEEDDGQG